ncbi:MAG: hypothetical protein WBB50_12620 [Methyloceanibacter sp.]
MMSEQDKIAYLADHISYEVVMLNYTFMRVLTSRPSTPEGQLDFNVHLESFGVHAHNLVEFFSRKPGDDARSAFDYIPDFVGPDPTSVEPALLRLDKQILRVTTLGSSEPQEKFGVDDARKLYAWIVPTILKFQGALGPRYRATLNALGSLDPLARSPAEAEPS